MKEVKNIDGGRIMKIIAGYIGRNKNFKVIEVKDMKKEDKKRKENDSDVFTKRNERRKV